MENTFKHRQTQLTKESTLMEAFQYNLDCYDDEVIDKEDFINAMEQWISHLTLPNLKREIDVVIDKVKEEIIDVFSDDDVLPKNWVEMQKHIDTNEFFADYLTDLSFDCATVITNKVDEWLREQRNQINSINNWKQKDN